MTNNHRLALNKLKNFNKDNPDVIALIICGSLARGQERTDSDVDLYLVYTDEAFEEVKKKKRISTVPGTRRSSSAYASTEKSFRWNFCGRP